MHIPIIHRQFFKIVIIFILIAMIVEILFILHVVNGIHTTIHNFDRFTYMNTYTNTSIIIFLIV